MQKEANESETYNTVFVAPGLEVKLFDAVEARSLQGFDSPEVLTTIVDWCENFLGRPSGLLGRSGNVCPFVPEAMLRGSLKFGVIRLPGGEDPLIRIESAISAFRERFIENRNVMKRVDIFSSWVMLFPDVKMEEAELLIDGPQRRMKPQFVKEGLMLGEFHPLSRSPGIRNPSFRPLRSPCPLLVIRHMVESDIEFLGRAIDPAPLRAESLRAFLKFLGPSLSIATKQVAKKRLEQAEMELKSEAREGVLDHAS